MKKENLTKEEAIQAMKEGHKVAHRYFSDDEWMTLDGDKFLFEDGCRIHPYLFWIDRQSQEWNTDWRVVVPEIDALKQSNREMLEALKSARRIISEGNHSDIWKSEQGRKIDTAIKNAEGK
jgi:hypothetical protein